MGSAEPGKIKNNELYNLIKPREWKRKFDTPFVGYGDLYLEIDDYASHINATSPSGYPKLPEGPLYWEGPWPFQLPGNRDCVRNLTLITYANGALGDADGDKLITTGDWINFRDVIMPAMPRDWKSKELYPPKYAHLSGALAAKTVARSSRLQLSLPFMMIIIACNTVKLFTMIYVLLMYRANYLVTMGDSAVSFLEHPDPATERMCIMSKDEIRTAISEGYFNSETNQNDALSALIKQSRHTWAKQYSRYSSALNKDRQAGSNFM